MARFAKIIAAAGAVSLAAYGTARAASDITLAAIATGRLYVVGTTERPRTAVVLDGEFRTESNDKGLFQYELVYHPSRCIVSALIEGRTYEAVVSNCGEVCRPNPAGTAGLTFAPPPAAGAGSRSAPASGPPGRPLLPELPGSVRILETEPLAPSAAAAPPAPDATSAVDRDPHRIGARGGDAAPIVNPPLPPARPSFRLETRARSVRPGRERDPLRAVPREDRSEPEALPED